MTRSGFSVSFVLMLPFNDHGPIDRTERKALVVAGICCLVFIGFLGFVRRPAARIRKVTTTVTIPAPKSPTQILESVNPASRDLLARYRGVPDNFKHVDFRNRSYGLYEYANAREIDLKLTQSEMQLPKNAGWFSLQDVFYNDFTGDGQPEALVRLSHVECGGSCDGGADLFYIYTQRNGQLKTLWQYETGTYAYGCGLRSLTVNQRQLTLELFGRCPKPATDDPGTTKFLAKDLTFLLFEYDGQRFERLMIEYFKTRTANVKNYKPVIHIF